MNCPRCGAAVATGSKFCGDCGSPLPWLCADCGNENPVGKRFCSECGAASTGTAERASAPVTPPAPVAERRQLTVMFADLVGSTALGARLDPEDLREVVAAYHGCVTGLIAKLGGFVARYMGDGVLVYFGYPQANEDDAERSIRAGLAIVDAVAHLNTPAGPPGTLSARLGIATGLVIVGDLIGSGPSLESAAVGETPNLAARLQALADPGMVVIAEATRRLTGRLFEYRDLGEARLKGLDAPVRTWAVLGEAAIDSRFEALRPGQGPLIGRDEELSLLLRRWDQVKNGEGRVVLLSGEPGIGKSRLIAALEQALAHAAPGRVRLVCSPHYQDTPLHPVIRQIKRAARFQNDDSHVAQREKLRRLLGRSASDVDVSLVADLVSVPNAAEELPETLTPRQRKDMTFAAILAHVTALAQRNPLLAVVEDIHWADPTTGELLEAQIDTIEALPILLIVTARPEVRPAWASRPHVTIQMLGGLHHRQAVSIVNEVVGDASLPVEVVERIISHADGVPLFIEELTKTVLERHQQRVQGADQSPAEPFSAEMVPTSLQASLMARLDRLGAGKEVAQIGSVIGREFSFEAALALGSTPAERLKEALDQVVQAGLAFARGEPPDIVYSFKHALVQDAAYASMLRDRRRDLHLRLAEAFEKNAIRGIVSEPQLLAWHFGEAAVPHKSIDYYLKAAEQTTGRYAFAEMVSQLRKGLRQLKRLPDGADGQRRELALQSALGRALIDYRGSGSEEVREAFERARELCLAVGDTRQLLPVLDGLALNYHFAHSQPTRMLDYAAELFELGQRTGDAQSLLWARRARGSANLLLGRFEEARDEMQFVIETYRKNGNEAEDPRMARDPRVSTYTLFGICLTALGQLNAGAAMSSQGLRYAERRNDVVSITTGLRRVCVQRIMQRNTRDVADLSSRLLALSAEHETFAGIREGMIFRGWAAQLHGNRDAELFEQVQSALDQLYQQKHWVLLPFFMTSIAEVVGDNGDHAAAAALLDRAGQLVDQTGERWCEAEILRLKARFSAENTDEALALLRASIATAREQGAKLWELRAARNLAELLDSQGKRDAAAQLLVPIYRSFSEELDTPDLVDARAFLARFGDAAKPRIAITL
jgi:class 3 adenylate cyclase/energy-coupling factor transporter ATP-binding protein EcfA2